MNQRSLDHEVRVALAIHETMDAFWNSREDRVWTREQLVKKFDEWLSKEGVE